MARKIWTLVLILTLLVVGVACNRNVTPKQPKPKGNVQTEKPTGTGLDLVAVKATQAPAIDGTVDDGWKAAEAIKVPLAAAGTIGPGGEFDNGRTEVMLKAMYDADSVYMLLQWDDPTDSKARGPWVKENGNLVKKSYDEFYEDKLAVNWNINNSVNSFQTQGCVVTCHATSFTDDRSGKTIIKHYTNGADERLDMWHWKRTRQNDLFGADKPGLMHDQFMDNVTFDPTNKDTKSAGRHADPSEPKKEYEDNVTGDSQDPLQPKVVVDGPPASGNPYVIIEGLDKTKPFNPNMVQQMKDGDFIPGLIAKQISGDAADIKAKGKFENGRWTLEIQRKLETGSDKDVQFTDLDKKYYFGVAAFDNSQIGHAYQTTVANLTFKK
ncbi:MAG: ethylbenzene dehydrogenase-related protein [Bacillota bacterium]